MSATRGINDNMKTQLLAELRSAADGHWRVLDGLDTQQIWVGADDVIQFCLILPMAFVGQSPRATRILDNARCTVQMPGRNNGKFRYTSLFTGKTVVIPRGDLMTLREAKGAQGALAKLGEYDQPQFDNCRRLDLITPWGTSGKDAKQAALTPEGECALHLWHLLNA